MTRGHRASVQGRFIFVQLQAMPEAANGSVRMLSSSPWLQAASQWIARIMLIDPGNLGYSENNGGPIVQTSEQSYFDGKEFMTVRHLTVRGTNFEIGRRLGELAMQRYGTSPADYVSDPLYVRARRVYFQRNYPIHWVPNFANLFAGIVERK